MGAYRIIDVIFLKKYYIRGCRVSFAIYYLNATKL